MHNNNDPIIIGYCEGCGHPIYSNEDYFEHDGDIVHADGVGARAKVIGSDLKVNMSCFLLYLELTYAHEQAAELFGFERKKG